MEYFYDQQIKKYLAQFMAVFEGLEVRTGKRDDGKIKRIPVPVHYGSKDRVSAAFLAGNTQNKPIRLPILSAFMRNMNLAPELRKGRNHVRRDVYLDQGGVIPDDIKTVERLMPVPYTLDIDLTMYVSNMDQHLQLLEQILMMFDPILQIQKNDTLFDWTRISIIELTDIQPEEAYPVGTDRRQIVTTLSFRMPIYLSGPSLTKQKFVKDLFVRIGAVDISSFDKSIVDELDSQGLDYELVKSMDDLDLT